MTIQQLTAVQIQEVAANETHAAFLNKFYCNLESFEVIPEDSNGTGYYDGLVMRNLRKPVGTVLRAVTPGENNRRMLVVITPVGNVVLFERYTGGDGGVLVTNAPRTARYLVGSGRIDKAALETILGDEFGEPNIGVAILCIIEAARDVDFTADRLVDLNNC